MAEELKDRKEIQREAASELARRNPDLQNKPRWTTIFFWLAVTIIGISLLVVLYLRR